MLILIKLRHCRWDHVKKKQCWTSCEPALWSVRMAIFIIFHIQNSSATVAQNRKIIFCVSSNAEQFIFCIIYQQHRDTLTSLVNYTRTNKIERIEISKTVLRFFSSSFFWTVTIELLYSTQIPYLVFRVCVIRSRQLNVWENFTHDSIFQNAFFRICWLYNDIRKAINSEDFFKQRTFESSNDFLILKIQLFFCRIVETMQ